MICATLETTSADIADISADVADIPGEHSPDASAAVSIDPRDVIGPIYLPQIQLMNAFRVCVPAVETNSTRYALGNVQLIISGNAVTVFGTDSRRLHRAEFFAANRSILSAEQNEECRIPEFSAVSESVSILIPLDTARKLASVHASAVSMTLTLRRENGTTIAVFDYVNGRRKPARIVCTCSEGRFPRCEEHCRPLTSPDASIIGPSDYLAEYFRKPVGINLKVTDSRASVDCMNHPDISHDIKWYNKRKSTKHAFKCTGSLEVTLSDEFLLNYLETLPEQTQVTLTANNDGSAVQLSATFASVETLSVIMPLRAD